MHAVIDNFDLCSYNPNLNHSMPVASSRTPGIPVEYTKETGDSIAWMIMKILDAKHFPERRIVLLCDDLKVTAVFLMSLMNFCQAKHEDTMNINMSAQTILGKLPKDNFKNLPQLTDNEDSKDYENFYKSIFELVSSFMFFYLI